MMPVIEMSCSDWVIKLFLLKLFSTYFGKYDRGHEKNVHFILSASKEEGKKELNNGLEENDVMHRESTMSNQS